VSSWDDLRLQVTPGAGVVARSSAALLVVPVVADHQQPVLEQLVGLTRGAKPGSGRALARRLAAIVASSEPEDVPDLALFAGLGDDNVAVLVLGETEVDAETAGGHVALSGRDSLTWVDRVLQAPSRIVVGTPGSAQPAVTPWVDLVEGVVPGGGALLEQRGAQATARSSESAGSTSAVMPPAPSLPGAPTDAMPAVPDELSDRADEGGADEGDDDLDAASEAQQSDLVDGVYCKRGHFTDPDSEFCIVCGIELHDTKIKRKGVRPELGYFVFDDGSVFHLDHDYVLGRQPEVDDDVKAGTLRGLRLDDSGGTVSRAHAIVRLVGWTVTIADRKSQNGTLVAVKGSDQFVPVSRDEPITLAPGSRIQLGQRTLVYESRETAADQRIPGPQQ
jgi:hypothetical protein